MHEIRLATPADAAAVRAIYAPSITDGHASFEAEVPDEAEVAARVGRTLEALPWLVAVDGGGVLGYAYAGPHRARAAYAWCAEVSVYVAAGAQRRGVGRALYGGLHALLQAQGYVNLYAGIALPNAASVALHEGLGYRAVGVYRGVGYKAGAWRDVGWWHRRLPTPVGEPRPPVPLPALGAGAVADALGRAGRAPA